MSLDVSSLSVNEQGDLRCPFHSVQQIGALFRLSPTRHLTQKIIQAKIRQEIDDET
jgi:hypothetical protein